MRAYNAVVKNRIPRFIKDDYPALNEFIEAYYEWVKVEQIDKLDFKTIRDVENTFDEYLLFFKNTLAKSIPNDTSTDMRTLLMNIRQFFKSKGTEKSIKFFFKAFFNENVDIFFPRTQMFIPSDSTWVRNRIIKVSNVPGITLDNKEMTFTNGKFFVRNSYQENGDLVLSISDVAGNLENVDKVYFGNTEYTIKKQVVSIRVISNGSDFVPGTVYNLLNNVSVQVNEVIRGKITTIDVISGGSGYSGSEEILFTKNGPLGVSSGNGAVAKIKTLSGDSITEIEIVNGGSLYDLPPGVFCESTGTSAILRASGNFGGIKNFIVINGGHSLPENPWTETVKDANIEVVYGNVLELPGTFEESVGFASSVSSYLQDEHYYQYFSYVVKTGINFNQYSELMKKLVHPAGMKLFATFEISELVSTITSFKNTDLILLIQSFVEKSGGNVTNVLKLIIESILESGGVRIFQIDQYKFQWFNESTFINNYKNEIISGWCSEEIINPNRNTRIKIQPDLVIRKLNLAAIAGFGDSMGNENLGLATLG